MHARSRTAKLRTEITVLGNTLTKMFVGTFHSIASKPCCYQKLVQAKAVSTQRDNQKFSALIPWEIKLVPWRPLCVASTFLGKHSFITMIASRSNWFPTFFMIEEARFEII